ncbi:Imm58 family immunity protein [Rahnella selenatireducens]|uniref:Imm58 family immunity protein n=1 Tax=Rahnella selenatireducens TaxID=3389797 RepID=UPI00396939A0
MKKTTAILTILLFLSLISCVCFAYLWIDRSITLSYSEKCVNNSTQTTNALEILLEKEWFGESTKSVLEKVKTQLKSTQNENEIIKKDDGNVIWVGNIKLSFSNDRLIKVGE